MIQIKNIVKNYLSGDNVVHALKDVNLNFRNSEFVSILGPSGCGKTTLLNIIGGLDKYTSGDIVINGVSTKEYKDKDWDKYRNHYIGFVFQSYNLISHLSVLENVELALSIAGLNKHEKRQRAIDALKEVGLENQLKKKPNQLSGGQMQRVAIARAIVNKPKIILADEPTGALDSETSTQVMEILKKISKDYLIIMVTHNEELAQNYSTRIISVLDGNVVGDTNPFTPTKKEIEKDILENKENVQEHTSKIKKQKNSMKFLTALMLSIKNLWSKKGKTIIESFAGSIGIIGIALIIAVSTGFTNYINNVQSDALGNTPITVSAISMNMNKFASMDIKPQENVAPQENVVVPYNPMQQFIEYGYYNNFTQDFIAHVNEFENADKQKEEPLLNLVEYDYYTPVKMITKTGTGYKYIFRENKTSVLSGAPGSSVYPMLNNIDYVMEQYDLIYGRMPEIKSGDDYSKEMLLVVDAGNKVSIETLNNIGIPYEIDAQNGKFKSIDFEKVCAQEYKLLFNNDYYTPNSPDFDSITEFSKLDTTNQTELKNAFDSLSVTLKISGVIRLKKNGAQMLSSGLAYMPSLEKYYSNNCQNSLIAQKSLATKDTKAFYDDYITNVAEFEVINTGFKTSDEINNYLFLHYGYKLTDEEAFELGLQQIGISKIPVGIRFYPKNFDGKDAVLNMIAEYNNNQTNENLKINYTDTSSFLTATLGQMIDIISYVLIAFAGISLVVSSVMIGIITYTSVIERTKEIGVLRSIGARKKDISRIFNTETILIGFIAGSLGVLVSFILTFPISAIIKKVAGGAIATNIAVLNPLPAIILILISTLLTAIAGTVPARLASKKDPVLCLRSE